MQNALGRGACTRAMGLIALALCAVPASPEQPGPYDAPVMNETDAAVKTPETIAADWPARSRSAARALIAKYGEPSSFDDDRLTWYDNGPWRKTVVYRSAPQNFPGLHGKDILEQSISYAAPDNKRLAELKRFDDRLEFDGAIGELSSRSESESLNYLALNLADEIVAGRRDAVEARGFYKKTLRLAASGKTSVYLNGFLFRPSGAPPRP